MGDPSARSARVERYEERFSIPMDFIDRVHARSEALNLDRTVDRRFGSDHARRRSIDF